MVFAVPAAFVFFFVHSIGGSNPHTAAGHEGYVFHQPLVFGQRQFVKTQKGPNSTGWRWRQDVTNIDMRVQTWSEKMQIFSADNLEVHFDVHARISAKPGTVKQIVEKYSGSAWYVNIVRRPYRTAVLEEVRKHDAFEIKDKSEAIAHTILTRLKNEYRKTPFVFHSISVGNIDYPASVTERVEKNLGTEQRRQRMDVERKIAEGRAKIREMRANGEANAQEIEQATLTPLFVQHEAADLYNELAEHGENGSKANVIIVIPTRADRAGVPRIYGGK